MTSNNKIAHLIFCKVATGYGIKAITHASGACNPGSIPGTPTEKNRRKPVFVFYLIRFSFQLPIL